jgi:hypothetical protein
MTTRKSSTGKAGAKKLKVKKQTLKDLDPKRGKKVAGGVASGRCSPVPNSVKGCNTANLCQPGTVLCDPGTAMTNCFQITCAGFG